MALSAYQRDYKNISGLSIQIKRAIQLQAFNNRGADPVADPQAYPFFLSVYAGRTKFSLNQAATLVYDLSAGTAIDLEVLRLSATDAQVYACVGTAVPILKQWQLRDDLPVVDFR